MKKTLLSLLAGFFIYTAAMAQVKPLLNAHAHNDYEHTHPLQDALNYGFTSVEADVYLITGKLYVSHKRPEQLDDKRTLSKLYLDPIQKRIKKNKGTVYKDSSLFYLMIDIKNDSINTYLAIKKELLARPELQHNPNFVVFLSGGRDIAYVLKDADGLIGIDGLVTDIGKSYTAAQVPFISASFKSVTGWNQKSPVTEAQFKLAKKFIDAVQADGKKARLWAAPDNLAAWKRLYADGMDLINSDKLKELSEFLREETK